MVLRKNLSEDVSCSQKSNFLEPADDGCAWNFVNVFFQSVLNNPSAPITTSIVSVSIFHILILISKSLYLDSFSTTLTHVFLSDGTALSIIQHLWFVWSLIILHLVCWLLFLYQRGLAYSTESSLFHFLQQFLVCVHTIWLQMSWFYNSGTPSNGYVMLRYHVFECIQNSPVLSIQIWHDQQSRQTCHTLYTMG